MCVTLAHPGFSRCGAGVRTGTEERRESREKEANKAREEEEEEQSAGCVRCVYRGRTVATPALLLLTTWQNLCRHAPLSTSRSSCCCLALLWAKIQSARSGHSLEGGKRDLATDVFPRIRGKGKAPQLPGFGADTVQVAEISMFLEARSAFDRPRSLILPGTLK